MDQATKEKEKLNFVRVMVEVGIHDVLPENIVFCNEHGSRVEQKVEYEWRPIKCSTCKGFGHEGENCRNKDGKKIWVKKGKSVKDTEGFQQVGGRKQPVHQVAPVIQTHNSFHVLNEEAENPMKERNGVDEVQDVELDKRKNDADDTGMHLVDKGQGVITLNHDG